MFRLHDTTRRWVCVAAFLMFGLLPTLLVGGWCMSRYAPGFLQTEAERLGNQLGLTVTLEGGVQYLQPGIVLYEQVRGSDPETGRPVLRCSSLKVTYERPQDCENCTRPVLLVEASQPEIQAQSLDRVWRCLTRALEGYAGTFDADVQLFATEITLHKDGSSQTLTDIDGSLETLPDKMVAQVHFRLPEARTPEPARICIVRNRQVSPPTSRVELYTGGGALPCNVLAMGLRDLEPLGARSNFEGVIWANETPSGWQGEVTGTLTDLDLDQLVSERFPYKLGGRCTVKVGTARFRASRLEEGSAVVTAGPGTIDRALVQAASERLGLIVRPNQLPNQQYIPYDELAFTLAIDSQGIRLRGFCDAAEPGTILTCDARALVSESADMLKPAAALVQTLAPQSALQVPASRQTDWLMRHLPAAEITPTSDPSATPHISTRVRETRRQ